MTSQPFKVEDLFSIQGKVAVITGGSRGIGYMIAQGYVSNGVKVYISSRKAAVCDAAAATLSKIGPCISIPADLSTSEGRTVLVNTIKDNEESLDILVNNAGVAWGAPFDEYPEAGYDKTMAINVKALFMLTRDLMPLLAKDSSPSDPARVINIGSIDGLRVPDLDNFAYSASKAAVHHLTRVLAVQLAPRGVTVNAIAPGLFESKMTAWLLENFQSEVEASCPLGRIGAPTDMAGLAIYLASPAASYLNGTVIPLDGGLGLK